MKSGTGLLFLLVAFVFTVDSHAEQTLAPDQVAETEQGSAGPRVVEQGEIKFPVHEVTIAGNLKEMFKNIRCVGNDLDHRSSVLSGSILIDGMTVAGS